MTIAKKLLLTTFNLTVLGVVNMASAAVLVTWNTTGNTGSEPSEPVATIDGNLVGSLATLIVGPGVNPAANGNRFGGNNWSSTLDDSVTANDYIEFTISPLAGSAVSLSSLEFIWDRSGTGPSSVALRSSADGFDTTLGSVTGMSASTTVFRTLDLTGFSTFSTGVTFRLYGYGATASTGTGGFDTSGSGAAVPNVKLNGEIVAVPEPSTWMALVGGVGMLACTRRMRRV